MSQLLNGLLKSTHPFEGKFDDDLTDFNQSTFVAPANMGKNFKKKFFVLDAVLPSLNETANNLSNSLFIFTPAENPLPLRSSIDLSNNIPAVEITNSLENRWNSVADSFNALPKTQDERQAINTAQNMMTVINNKSLLENPFSGQTSGELTTLLAETPNALVFLSKELASNSTKLGRNYLDLTFEFLEGKDFTTAIDLFHQANIKQNINLKGPFDKGMNIGLHALVNIIQEPGKFIDGIIDTINTAGILLGHSLIGTNKLTKHTEMAADSREYVSNFTSQVINGSIKDSEKYLNLGIPEVLTGQLVFAGVAGATGGIAIEAGAIKAVGKIINATNKVLPTDGLNGTFLAQSIGRVLPALKEKHLNGNILLPSFSHRFNAISKGSTSAANDFKKLTNEFDPSHKSKTFSDKPEEWLEIPGDSIDPSFDHSGYKSVSEIKGNYPGLLIGIFNKIKHTYSYDDKVNLIQTEKSLLGKLKEYGIPTLVIAGFARVVGDGPHIAKLLPPTGRPLQTENRAFSFTVPDFFQDYFDDKIGLKEFEQIRDENRALYKNVFNINSVNIVGNANPPIELEKGFPAIIYERAAGGSLMSKSKIVYQNHDPVPLVKILPQFKHFITPQSLRDISLMRDIIDNKGIYINDLELFITINRGDWGISIGDPLGVGALREPGPFTLDEKHIHHENTRGILLGYQKAFEKIIKGN